MEIVVDDLTGPQIASFLDEHVSGDAVDHALPESKHALDLETLRGPGITLLAGQGRRDRGRLRSD